MSDSVQLQRQQPTRLPRPWDSPGKNPGVGCHFLLQCMKVKSESEVSQLCPTPSNPMGCSLPGSSLHGIFQGRILEWVAISFPRRSSPPRDRTPVSHISGRCFNVWATRDSLNNCNQMGSYASRLSGVKFSFALWGWWVCQLPQFLYQYIWRQWHWVPPDGHKILQTRKIQK